MTESEGRKSPLDLLMLSGRRALVTGAARGFGFETAMHLRSLGASVAMLDVEREHVESAAAPLAALAVSADIADAGQVRAAWEVVERELGGVDILVNNAGIASSRTLLELDYGEWSRVQAVNVDGLFHLCSLALPGMVERRFGRIVNVSSIAGLRGGGNVGRVAYATSKAAVVGFTKAVAREYARSGVTCNAVAPGGMDTEMTRALAEDPARLARVLESIPLGYRGGALDVAGAIAFLVSGLAGYITGETLIVDGGVMMH